MIINANNLERVRESFKSFQNEIENRQEVAKNGRRLSNVSKCSESLQQSQAQAQIDNKVNEASSYLIQTIEQIIGFIYDYKVNFVF